jgi:hypothetical protein
MVKSCPGLVVSLALLSSGVSARRHGSNHQIKGTIRKTVHSGSSINVEDFGAYNDCTDFNTSSTDAFQTALNQAGVTGETVVIPEGCFAFDGSLDVPEGVTLMGSWQTVPSHDYRLSPPQSATNGVGTTLMPFASRGDDTGSPFITLNANAKLAGVVIFYPEQLTTEPPQPYPYSIAMIAANAAVTDVELLNSFNGIYAVAAHRHYIARVQGQPTNMGIFVDETYDIGRIEDIHFNPWYSMEPAYFDYQVQHGRAFVLGRSDWEYVLNTFSFGYAIGYHFINTDTGSMNGNFLGIGADLCYNASVHVDASQPAGILITNGEFTAFTEDSFPVPEGWVSSQVYVGSDNTGPVKFVDSSFWGPDSSVALIEGSGTTTFSACEFVQWADQDDKTAAAIELSGSGALIVTGCAFQQDSTQLKFSNQASRAIFSNNVLSGKEKVVDTTAKGVNLVGLGTNI